MSADVEPTCKGFDVEEEDQRGEGVALDGASANLERASA